MTTQMRAGRCSSKSNAKVTEVIVKTPGLDFPVRNLSMKNFLNESVSSGLKFLAVTEHHYGTNSKLESQSRDSDIKCIGFQKSFCAQIQVLKIL